jgi:hypothetical protein
VDKTLDAAGVLRKLKDQTCTIVSSWSGPVEVSSIQIPPVPKAYPKGGLNAWYCPGQYDISNRLWLDCSGNGNWALLSGSGFKELLGKGNGATYNNVSALAGTTKSTIQFGTKNNVIQSEFTVCSVTRYITGGNMGRILQGKDPAGRQGSKNWLHGHQQGNLVGVAFYGDGWKTKIQNNFSPGTNWLVMCGTNAGAGSQLKLANGKSVGIADSGWGDMSLWVNGLYNNLPNSQNSDFAIAEVVVWSRGLTDKEMIRASNYLMESRGIKPATST